MFLHRELERFPAGELAALVSGGVLRETSRATEIPRPAHLPAGGDLIVRPTSRGLFGVPDEDDYFTPIPLTDDDVRMYEVSLPRLAAGIRRENEIDGTGFENHDGLIPLGQKMIDERGAVDVYLSLPNEDEAVLLSRCRRLKRPARPGRLILVTPRGASLSPEGQGVLDSADVILASLAATGGLALDWNTVLPRLPEMGAADVKALDARIMEAITAMIADVVRGQQVSRSKDEVARRLNYADRKGLEFAMNACGLAWKPYQRLLRPQKEKSA